MADLTVKIDMKDVLSQIPELQRMINHYQAIDILISGIKSYMPEPYASMVLSDWDNARK